MNPYFAVILDSFNEAIRSKVLWVLIFCWTLILGGIAPFGFIQDKSFTFKGDDIVDDAKLIELMTNALDGRGSKAQQTVVKAMDAEFHAFLKQRKGRNDVFTPRGRVVRELNDTLAVKELYDPQIWPKADRRSELKDLVSRPADELSKLELEQRNRRLIELSFPNMLRSVNENRTWIGYAGLKTPIELPISVKQARQYIEALFFPAIMKLGLGIIAMLVAIIITSPMIPDMFQSGALHLLLSKPVSRAMLFLSKFVGGCIFVAMNIAYMLVGLYFISGFRLGIWNTGILICIPIFIFVFMIFYSVSGLAGLIWKNAIVSVVVTGVFWGLCLVVGFVYGITTPIVREQPMVRTLTVAGDRVFSSSQQGLLQVWDDKSNEWKSDYGLVPGPFQFYGPFWNASEGRLLFARTNDNPLGRFGDSTVRFRYARYPELATGKPKSEGPADEAASEATTEETSSEEVKPEPVTNESDSSEKSSDVESPKAKSPSAKQDKGAEEDTSFWNETRVDMLPDFPAETRRVIPFRDSVLAVSTRGVYLFNIEAALKAKDAPKVSIFGMSLPVTASGEAFKLVTPETWTPKAPLDVAAAPDGKRLFVFSQGKLQRLDFDNSDALVPFDQTGQVSDDEEQLALIGTDGQSVLVASDKSVPVLFSAETLAKEQSLDAIGKVTPRMIQLAPNGKLMGLLTSDGELWLIDSSAKSAKKAPIANQGGVHGFCFDPQGRLWYSHHVTQVDCVNLESSAVDKRMRPTLTTLGWIYGYLIEPFYTVNPKPSAVDETIAYVLRKDDSMSFLLDTNDLNRETRKIDPWTPLWSNALFIVFMLGIGCVILYRQDL